MVTFSKLSSRLIDGVTVGVSDVCFGKNGREVQRQLAVAVGHSYFRPSGVELRVDTEKPLYINKHYH